MGTDDVLEVLDRLDAAGVECWVEGGWGIDALLGRQTRQHRDLDLAVRLADVPAVESCLHEYRRVETGEWPKFLILEDDDGRTVDLNLTSDYAGHAITNGQIAGRTVRCVPWEYQVRRARTGDVAALRRGSRTPFG